MGNPSHIIYDLILVLIDNYSGHTNYTEYTII